MASNTISISVLADVKNISSGIDNIGGKLSKFESSIGKVGSALKNMALAGGALALGGGITAFFGSAITGASDLQETLNKSNTIFGDQAATINKWAQTASTSVGLSKAAALDAAAGFGNMFSQLGFAGAEAANMSTKVVQMSADLGSFNNLPTADVADKISAAFRGEYDSLQALIPNINAARVEQEAMAMTGKTSASALTAQEKAAATLAIVQRDGAAAMGDFAKTSDGLANKQKIAAAQFEDMKAKIGDQLLPVMNSLFSFILSTGLPALQDVGNFIMGTVVPGFQQMAQFVQQNQGLFTVLAVGIAAATVAFTAHSAWLAIVSAATKAYAAVQLALNVVMSANPIGLVILAITSLVAAIIIAWKNSETFRNIVTGAWNAVKAAAEATKNGIVSAWNAVVSFTTSAFNNIKNVCSSVWSGIQSLIASAISRIISVVAGIVAVYNTVRNAFDNARSAAANGVSNMISVVSGLPGRIVGAVGNMGGVLVNAGRQVIQGLINGVTGMIGSLRAKFTSITNMIPDWKGPMSKDKTLLTKTGEAIMGGLIKGIDNETGALKGTLNGVTDLIANTAVPALAGDVAVSSSASLSTRRRASSATGQVVNNYNIYDATDPQKVVSAIKSYNRQNGNGWMNR
jgi:phage-related protein